MNTLSDYLEKLESQDETERSYAAEDIGYLNEANGVESLLARLGKEDSRAVREAIFQALLRIDADTAIEGSIRLLESDDPQIRNQAVEILQRKGVAAIPFLKTVMRDGDNDLRKLVLDVLSCREASGVGGIYTEGIYELALMDPDINVVITVVENLGRTRSTRFRTRIENLLTADAHPMLVGACLEALAGIAEESSLAAIRKRFPDSAALSDFFLASWLKAIAALGSTKEFAEVAGLLPLRGAHLRPAILGALIAIHQRHPAPAEDDSLLPALQAVVDDGDPPLCRYEAVRALGFLSSRDDVYALLVSCLSSSERLVRLGAIESLRLTPQPELQQLLDSRALEETDEEVLRALNCRAEE
jgi:HEAT repeat protein